jgi:hypothetical protein
MPGTPEETTMPRKNAPGRVQRAATAHEPAAAETVSQKPDFAAPQQNGLDASESGVTRVSNRESRKEITMDQKTVFTQMQQFGSEWLKLVAEGTNRFTATLAEVEKIEKQGVAQVVSAVDEAGRVAKEAINASEQISAQWRKAVNEYAQRTLELLTPKN